MSDPQVTDFLGNLVSIGDRVVVVFREEQVRVGIVEAFGSRVYVGRDTPTMTVIWEKCTGRTPDKNTAVDLESRIFIKLFEQSS